MQLLNIMSVADDRISMILVGKRPDNVEIGYDFENNKWMDDNIIENSTRITTIGEFRNTDLYRLHKKCVLTDFSTMKKNHVKEFRDIDTFRNTVLIIKILLSCEKFPEMKKYTKKSQGIKEKKRFFPSKRKKEESES